MPPVDPTSFKVEPPESRAPTPTLGEDDDDDEMLPPHLIASMSPAGTIHGRSPAMVAYLVQKAKYRYALSRHEVLLEELRTLRGLLKEHKERKDEGLDDIVRAEFG